MMKDLYLNAVQGLQGCSLGKAENTLTKSDFNVKRLSDDFYLFIRGCFLVCKSCVDEHNETPGRTT